MESKSQAPADAQHRSGTLAGDPAGSVPKDPPDAQAKPEATADARDPARQQVTALPKPKTLDRLHSPHPGRGFCWLDDPRGLSAVHLAQAAEMEDPRRGATEMQGKAMWKGREEEA